MSKDTRTSSDLRFEVARLNKRISDVSRYVSDCEKREKELRSLWRELHREMRDVSALMLRAEHIEAGKCSKQMDKGDAWHPYYENCANKAKPGSEFCGVHTRKSPA